MGKLSGRVVKCGSKALMSLDKKCKSGNTVNAVRHAMQKQQLVQIAGVINKGGEKNTSVMRNLFFF